MIKSNFSKNEKHPVILSMNVDGGAATAFQLNLKGQEIDEIETLIEKIINENIDKKRSNKYEHYVR